MVQYTTRMVKSGELDGSFEEFLDACEGMCAEVEFCAILFDGAGKVVIPEINRAWVQLLKIDC